MPIDSSIALNLRPPDIGSMAVDYQKNKMAKESHAIQMQKEQATLDEHKATAPDRALKRLGERDEARLKSLVFAAQKVKPLMEANDIEGTKAYLTQRKQKLDEEGIDSSDTQEMIDAIDKDPSSVLNAANQTIQFGQQMGLLKSTDTSIDLKEIYDDKSPTGTRFVKVADAVGKPGKPSSGLSVTTNPDGTVSLTQGRGAGGLQKPTMSKIEEKQLNSVDLLARLGNVKSGYKDEFLKLGPRFSALATSWKERTGVSTSKDEQAFLHDFSKFRRSALNNMNVTLKEMSGAAVTPQEYERIKTDFPNAGSGIFDGDSPTEFVAKTDSVIKDTKRALIRYHYARRMNMDPLKTGIELADVDDLINRRGKELEAAAKKQNPNADQNAIQLMVRDQIANEFGLE